MQCNERGRNATKVVTLTNNNANFTKVDFETQLWAVINLLFIGKASRDNDDTITSSISMYVHVHSFKASSVAFFLYTTSDKNKVFYW